jgi:hypothetical protein
MATHEDDRAAYLEGKDRQSLTAGDRAELDELRSVLGSQAVWAEPSTELEDRIVTSIAEEAATRPASAVARRSRLPVPRRSRWSRPAFAFGGLAAAVVVGALAVALATNKSSRPSRQFAMVVSGTPLAPSAKGSATLTRTPSGWRIQLEAAGLPRLASGRFYEAWLKSPGGVLVPVGTFNDARNVTLWAGVPPTEYPSLTVTRQRAGRGPASSGERVLTGSIRTPG